MKCTDGDAIAYEYLRLSSISKALQRHQFCCFEHEELRTISTEEWYLIESILYKDDLSSHLVIEMNDNNNNELDKKHLERTNQVANADTN